MKVTKSNGKNHWQRRLIRHAQVRKKVIGTSSVPRLAVFRSNKHIYAQIIDDAASHTIISLSDLKFPRAKSKEISKTSKIKQAYEVGLNLAKTALSKKIKKTVFDRGGYKYHGRIKSLAEGARKGGLVF